MDTILNQKYYNEPSVFLPENLLREARRQKNIKDCDVPSICVLDPDGDLADYLIKNNLAVKNDCWACYHSTMYEYNFDGHPLGIIPCIVGSSYAVLVAEQLFVSGCKLLISITSAGIISELKNNKHFALITSSIRDEGTSYHYLPVNESAILNKQLFEILNRYDTNENCPYFHGISWTTDAPYRETQSAIDAMKKQNITCVEMEAAALYALSAFKNYRIICFAHLTNSMAQAEGDFEKGEEFGSLDSLNLIRFVLGIPEVITDLGA
ncbi:MAG: nucleoside phosphorylase [Ginsengibacter sp.]